MGLYTLQQEEADRVMCENSYHSLRGRRPVIGAPACRNKKSIRLKVIYTEDHFGVGADEDVLELCTECADGIQRSAESSDYRVERENL